MDIIKNLHRNVRKMARTQLDKFGIRDLVPAEDAPYLIDFVQEFISSKPPQPQPSQLQPVPEDIRQDLKMLMISLCGNHPTAVSMGTQWLEDRHAFFQANKDIRPYAESCDHAEAELQRILQYHHVLEQMPTRRPADILPVLQRISLSTERPIYNLLALAWSQSEQTATWEETDLNSLHPSLFDHPFFKIFNERLQPYHIQIAIFNDVSLNTAIYLGIVSC